MTDGWRAGTEMSEAFEAALAKVLELEGGWVNHPADPGGETYRGVTRKNWDGWLRARFGDAYEWPPKPDQVRVLYREVFWDGLDLDRFPPEIAVEVFKMHIHASRHAAIRILQRALRANLREWIADDGVLGPQTWGAVARCEPAATATAMRSEAARHYDALVRSRPDLEPFHRGWINRAYA